MTSCKTTRQLKVGDKILLYDSVSKQYVGQTGAKITHDMHKAQPMNFAIGGEGQTAYAKPTTNLNKAEVFTILNFDGQSDGTPIYYDGIHQSALILQNRSRGNRCLWDTTAPDNVVALKAYKHKATNQQWIFSAGPGFQMGDKIMVGDLNCPAQNAMLLNSHKHQGNCLQTGTRSCGDAAEGCWMSRQSHKDCKPTLSQFHIYLASKPIPPPVHLTPMPAPPPVHLTPMPGPPHPPPVHLTPMPAPPYPPPVHLTPMPAPPYPPPHHLTPMPAPPTPPHHLTPMPAPPYPPPVHLTPMPAPTPPVHLTPMPSYSPMVALSPEGSGRFSLLQWLKDNANLLILLLIISISITSAIVIYEVE